MKTFKEFITEDTIELDEATYHLNRDVYLEVLDKLGKIQTSIQECLDAEEKLNAHFKSGSHEAYPGKYPKDLNKELLRTATNAIFDHINARKALDEDTILEWAMEENLVELDEAFKAGTIKLKDGNSAKISKTDAGLLNALFSQMSSANKIKFMKSMENSLKDFKDALLMAKS